MFTGRTRYAILAFTLLAGMICLLYLHVLDWMIYPAVALGLLFVFQLFAFIRNANLEASLKRWMYTLAILLMIVVVSNILWVFVYAWFRYVASVAVIGFGYVLVGRLRE